MKTGVECLPCYLRQALQVARISTEDRELQLVAVQRVAELVAKMDMSLTPPENSVPVYRAIAQITDCADPYFAIKRESNERALRLVPDLKRELARHADPLAAALRLAIGGNIIDYGAMNSFDVDAAMEHCLERPLVIDHSGELLQQARSLEKGARVLYLADNSGEIVYDSLVVTTLVEMGLDVTVAVKSGPIINDALLADAKDCGIDQIATVLENGTSCPGTPLSRCSEALQRVFREADLIISKGQGNFETLSEEEAEIFFLLTVKCSLVGAHLAEISGNGPEHLAGRGELVLYHHRGIE